MESDCVSRTITIRELADLLKISRIKAYQLTREGQIKSIRIGRSIRIPLDAYRKFLQG